jgi:hypothetical protein
MRLQCGGVLSGEFRSDPRTVGIHVLRLHAGNGSWIAARASCQCEANGHRQNER